MTVNVPGVARGEGIGNHLFHFGEVRVQEDDIGIRLCLFVLTHIIAL